MFDNQNTRNLKRVDTEVLTSDAAQFSFHEEFLADSLPASYGMVVGYR